MIVFRLDFDWSWVGTVLLLYWVSITCRSDANYLSVGTGIELNCIGFGWDLIWIESEVGSNFRIVN